MPARFVHLLGNWAVSHPQFVANIRPEKPSAAHCDPSNVALLFIGLPLRTAIGLASGILAGTGQNGAAWAAIEATTRILWGDAKTIEYGSVEHFSLPMISADIYPLYQDEL